jgi:hypothetical protein
MKDYSSQKYDEARNKIKKFRNKKLDWEIIKKGNTETEDEFNNFLKYLDIEDFTKEDYLKIVESQKKSEETEKSAIIKGDLELDEETINTLQPSTDDKSSWQLYVEKLRKKGFTQESIDEIEITTNRILNLLNKKSVQVRKGLVVGNVQSGKTASMAALMAMGADQGWNTFIVLSGTIENLRKQTQARLLEDLNEPGNLTWIALEALSKSTIPRLQDLQLGEGSRSRYFNVTLKNKSRLEKLLGWLNGDKKKKEKLKIIIIDDEADQASVNTGKNNIDERKAINDLILKIVNNKSKDEAVPYGSMNYIAYTATPYANVLNEASDKSLFPRDFVVSLKTSNKYFGPQEIFGGSEEGEDGINIIREINQEDLSIIKKTHQNKNYENELPKSLKNSLYWFLCGVATMRYWKYNKPVSMLVHTSQNQKDHDKIFELINTWFKKINQEELLEEAGKVWVSEVSQFSKDHFKEQLPNYLTTEEDIRDYPKFEDIKKEILKLRNSITHIRLDEEQELNFDKNGGIHICVDNCSKNKTDDDLHMRLAYPNNRDRTVNDTTPAFIVIGGATISRGLTLEGLISSYFLRSVSQADTLMQMGRWFGYRKGYELLPRIWITENVNNQFKFLSNLDEELRESIKEMERLEQSPLDYGVKVKNSPNLKFIRLTSSNKMQGAVEAEYDFSGLKNQTTYFDNDIETLESNKILGKIFLDSLPNPKLISSSMVWEDIKFEGIKTFLQKYKFNDKQRMFSKIYSLIEWIDKATEQKKLMNWEIILVGRSEDEKISKWDLKHGEVTKVSRSRRKSLGDGTIDIGALFSTSDIFINIDRDIVSRYESSTRKTEVNKILEEAGKEKTPQLFIYLIDKDSKPSSSRANRSNLEAVEDVLGIAIVIPGSRFSNSQAIKLVVNLEDYKKDITDESGE